MEWRMIGAGSVDGIRV